MTYTPDPYKTRLVYLVSGQVIIGSTVMATDGTLIVSSPREVMATPGFDSVTGQPNGKMEISMIPYGHLAGYQIAQAPYLRLDSHHYYTVLAPLDPELESKFTQSISTK